MMAFIGFVMIAASGFAAVIRATGAIEPLVSGASGIMGDSHIVVTRGTNDTENQPDLTLLHRILQLTRQNTLFLRGAQNVLQETPGAIEQTSKRNEIRPCALSSHTGMNQKSITEGFFGG